MKNQTINPSIDFWKIIIKEGLHHHHQKQLQATIRLGIPPTMRKLAWPAILALRHHHEFKSSMTYQQLLKQQSSDMQSIQLDAVRTASNVEHKLAWRKSFMNVLKAISIAFPHIGYRSGMSFLAMRILEVVGEEQKAFEMMYGLIQSDAICSCLLAMPEFLDEVCIIFASLVESNLSVIYDSLKKFQIPIIFFAGTWFITLFSYATSQEMFSRIFENYLYQGWTHIFSAALAVLESYQDSIISQPYQNVILLLSRPKQLDSQPLQVFMSKAHSYNIPNQQIQSLQQKARECLEGKQQKLQAKR